MAADPALLKVFLENMRARSPRGRAEEAERLRMQEESAEIQMLQNVIKTNPELFAKARNVVRAIEPSKLDFLDAQAKAAVKAKKVASQSDLASDPTAGREQVLNALRQIQVLDQGPDTRQAPPASLRDVRASLGPIGPNTPQANPPFRKFSEETLDSFQSLNKLTRDRRVALVDAQAKQAFEAAKEGRQLGAQFFRESSHFIASRNALGQLESIASEPASNIRDASLIRFFARLLNPVGVLSDEDVAATLRQTFGEFLGNKFTQVFLGTGSLTKGQITQILGVARSVHREQRTNQDVRVKNFSTRAKEIGVRPQSVVGSVRVRGKDAPRPKRPRNAYLPNGESGGIPNPPNDAKDAQFIDWTKDGYPVFVLPNGDTFVEKPYVLERE